MDKVIKNILKRIENEGYEAYIVGGFVRDTLLGKTTYDVDICTNALPMNLIQIFSLNQNGNGYGGFNIKLKRYNIDITTYRKEKKYDKRKPVEVEYINNLFEDIKRRDFTINSLCMDKNGNIIDLINGRNDLQKGIIRIIGDADNKFKEDPLRMLRAIRFATIFNFDIEDSTLSSIIRNSELVASLSSDRIKEELSKILSNNNFKKGLNLLRETKLDKAIGLEYQNVVYTSDLLGMWSQIDIKKVIFSNTEQENISKVRQLLRIKKIENFELFNYGLYLCTVAGQILGVDLKLINRKYKNLPIKSMKDIDINGAEIMDLLNIEPSKKVSDIIKDIKVQILSGQIKNRKPEIKKYILRMWKDE